MFGGQWYSPPSFPAFIVFEYHMHTDIIPWNYYVFPVDASLLQ